MNAPHASDPRPSPPGAPEPTSRRLKPPEDSEDSELFPWLADLWEGRTLLLASVAVFVAVGLFYVWWAPPVYQTEAMLQIQAKKERPSDTAFTKMESIFSEPVEAAGEIEIIRSNLVLGRTVEALALDVVAEPEVMPLIGAALERRKANPARLEIASFEVPKPIRGIAFRLTALPGGGFQWSAPDGALLGKGKPGEELKATYAGEAMKLKVRELAASPGQKFLLSAKPMQDAIDALRQDLDVSERGKLTNILGLTFRGPNPTKCPIILNQIMEQYVSHKLERRLGTITKAQAILQGKLPELKAQLEAAESRLNQFRSRSGSVDLSREADVFLSQSAALSTQVSALKQKREELLRTYKENSDVVTTLDQQIGKLQQEQGHIDSRVRVMPGLQQEVVRLSREVQVATELYTALLNNAQQLQIASAGDLGNVVVVDRATVNLDPIAPKKNVLMLLSLLLGLAAGAGTAMLRRAIRRGVEDHRMIETKLGLPVFVTVPHSKAQRAHDETIQRSVDGLHVLAAQDSADLAVESLRSLRTMLNFYMKDALNPVILISGPSPMIGKSFISANFACVLAQAGSRVLLIDGDLRRGKLHKYFGLKNRLNGFSNVVSGQQEWESMVQSSGIEGLDFISTGLLPPNPSDLLMTPRLANILDQVSKKYDYVIVDAPPVLPVTDATILGSHAATVLMVAKFGQHPLDELRAAQKRFESHGIRVKGCIFNDIKPVGWGGNYRHYNYIYNYDLKK
jgi:tyrosine-protein kinase Etk/Wzc